MAIEKNKNGLSEVVKVPFKNKVFILHFEFLDLDIDINELTLIDYSNLFGEFITISTLLNKIGIIRAEAEGNMDGAKLDRDIKYAELDEHYRKTIKHITTDAKGNDKTKYATNDEVDAAIKRDEVYITLCRRYIRMKKEYGYIDALYWGVDSKRKKLDRVGENLSLTPEEFENNIVEGVVNGIKIQARDKFIKD